MVDHTAVTLVFIWSQEPGASGHIKLSDSSEKLQTKCNVTALTFQEYFVFFIPLKKFLVSQSNMKAFFFNKQNFRNKTQWQCVIMMISIQNETALAAYQCCHHLTEFREVN